MCCLMAFFTALMLLAGGARADAFPLDGPCNVYFSPHGGTETALVNFISSAQKSVYVLAYNFTSPRIGSALISAKGRGVEVQVVLDSTASHGNGALLPVLRGAGIPVWIDKTHKIAHNKVIVVDGLAFETGSYNYTASAENSNGENALVCPSRAGAHLYTQDFYHHQGHSEVAP